LPLFAACLPVAARAPIRHRSTRDALTHRLSLFDNRTGQLLPHAFGQPLAVGLEPHAVGYTLLAEFSSDEVGMAVEWQLEQTTSRPTDGQLQTAPICGGVGRLSRTGVEPLQHQLASARAVVAGSTTTASTSTSTSTTNGTNHNQLQQPDGSGGGGASTCGPHFVIEPQEFAEFSFAGTYAKLNPWESLFRILVRAKTAQELTVYLETDQPGVSVQLRVMQHGRLLAASKEGSVLHATLSCVPLLGRPACGCDLLVLDCPDALHQQATAGADTDGYNYFVVEGLAEGFASTQLVPNEHKLRQLLAPTSEATEAKAKGGRGDGGGGTHRHLRGTPQVSKNRRLPAGANPFAQRNAGGFLLYLARFSFLNFFSRSF
jgi:hypothetical protein